MHEIMQKMAEEGYDPDYAAYSYGGSGRGGPTAERLQQLLKGLQSGDNSLMTQALMELASELSMTQDSTMSQRVLDQLVGPLLQCLDVTGFPNILSTWNASRSSACHSLSHAHHGYIAAFDQQDRKHGRRHQTVPAAGLHRVVRTPRKHHPRSR